MIRVTCQIDDYSQPRKSEIKVHNHWNNSDLVELEVNGERYSVKGKDLITAIQNAMNTNQYCF